MKEIPIELIEICVNHNYKQVDHDAPNQIKIVPDGFVRVRTKMDVYIAIKELGLNVKYIDSAFIVTI